MMCIVRHNEATKCTKQVGLDYTCNIKILHTYMQDISQLMA